jgi:hypothetical protein
MLLTAYETRVAVKAGPPGRGSTISVEILRPETSEVIGTFERNYHTLFRTFRPFAQDGRVYALYSPHYTATRIMLLPDCTDLGGEEPDPGGFCPVDYWVADDGTWGLVAGCYFGDDSSWKVQYLDLADASQGRVARDDRFGIVELPDDLNLADAVTVEEPRWAEDEYPDPNIRLRTVLRFNVPSGRRMASSD